MTSSVRRGAAGILIMLCCGAYAASHDTAYPSRPIRLVVAVPPGGAADFTARIVAHKLTDALGQNLVVENRGGAGGTIASDIASTVFPDRLGCLEES